MHKRYGLVISVMLALLIMSLAVEADTGSIVVNSKFGALKGELYPQPVRPGADLFLKINIQNIDAREADNVFLVLEVPDQFSFKYADERSVIVKQLVGIDSYEQDYHLSVSPKARSGLYDFDLMIRSESNQTSFKQNIKVLVEGLPDLAITEPFISNRSLRPGDTFDLGFVLENKGTGNAENIRVVANLHNLPIVPLKDNSEYIESIAPGESRNISFPFRVSKDAKITSYQIPVIVQANDDTGTRFLNSSEVVGIDLLGDALPAIASLTTEPSIVSEDSDFFMIIRVGNSGTGIAKAVVGEIDLPLEGMKKAFINKIDPKEDAPLVFTLKSKNAGCYPYRLNLVYQDDFGGHSVAYDMNLCVSKRPMGIFTVSHAIIAFLLLVIFYLILKKNHKK